MEARLTDYDLHLGLLSEALTSTPELPEDVCAISTIFEDDAVVD